MPLPEQIVDSVAIDNVKSVAGASAFYAGLAMSDAVSDQRAMSLIRQASVGAVVKNLNETDPMQAMAVNKALTGNDVASQMQALLAALNSGGQGVKSLTVTPPESQKVKDAG